MKIGFVGFGVVGAATAAMVERDKKNLIHAVYDPRVGRTDSMEGSGAVFISVPVPTMRDGRQDLSILNEAIERCPEYTPIFIRSSIVPSTTKLLQSHFQKHVLFALPEFLTERQAEADALTLPLVAPRQAAGFLKIILPSKELILVSNSDEAEMVKYVHNSFCAVKVGFFNTIHQYCQTEGLDYDNVVNAACGVTGFIEPTHTKVPGPDGQLGFGGKCLPKDLYAFVQVLEQLGKKTFLRDVLNENFLNRFGGLF